MKKSNLDEMQEQTLLRIEHYACWTAYWCLCISIIVQVLMGAYLDHILGEVFSLAVSSLYMLFACLRHGIWDRKLKPTFKANLLCSLAAGVFMGIVFWVAPVSQKFSMRPLFAIGLACFVFLFSLGVLSLCSYFYKKQSAKLEQE